MTAIARKPMSRAGMTVKSIDWSYPTSTNAERFNFKDGCWSVSVGRYGKPPHAVAGFKTKAEAIAHAGLLPYQWRGNPPTPEP